MSVERIVLDLRTSPHLRQRVSVHTIMLNVVYALLPVCAFSVYAFGLSALALLAVTTTACVLTEHLFAKLTRRESPVGDFSVTITGILLALTLPPGFPLWMAAVGGFVGVALGKLLFGGLGHNVFNPALVGRAFLQASFPVAITTWTPAFAPGRFAGFVPSTPALPFTTPAPIDAWTQALAIDGWTGATPLALFKFEHLTTPIGDLVTGFTAGSAGETSAVLILLGGLYLVARHMMDWRIPAGMLGAAFLLSGALYAAAPGTYPNPVFTLFSGGLMLGAVFMASDMVASPVTPLGVWIYAALMGGLTVIIRIFGGLPEGVMYAILLGNAASPLIDSLTQPRVFGTRKKTT